MAHTTKMKLKRTMREVLDDEACYVRRGADEQRGEDQWGLAVPLDPEISKRQKEAQIARIQEESRGAAPISSAQAEESDDEASHPEVQPEDLNVGETLVPARLHPDYENYVRLAIARVQI